MRTMMALLLFLLGSGQWAFAKRVPDAMASMLAPQPVVRTGQSATQLPDGRWLLIGGQRGERSATPEAGVANSAGGAVTALRGKLGQPRSGHTATLMPDGTVWILGGVDAAGDVVSTAEQFDPATGQFNTMAELGLIARSGHTATVLASNRLFVSGGLDQRGYVVHEAELVDVASRKVERFNLKLDTARVNHVAALLPGSDVLLWGGIGSDRKALAGGDIYKVDSHSIDALAAAGVAELGKSLKGNEVPALKSSQPAADDENAAPDQAIVVQFNQRMMMASLNGTSVTLIGPHGVVAAKVTPLEYGLLLFVTPRHDLLPGSRYTLFINDAKSAAGKPLPLTTLAFGTARLGMDAAPGAPDLAPAAGQSVASEPVRRAEPLARTVIDAAQMMAGGETWLPDGRHVKGDWRARRAASPLQGLPALRAVAGETALAGQVLTLHGRALENVTLTIGAQSTLTDDTGRFLLRQLRPGDAVLTIDGNSASRHARQYGLYQVRVKLEEGTTTVLPYTIWSPVLDPAGNAALPSPTTRATIVTSPRIPGLELHVPVGTVIRDRNGKIVRELNITAIPTDRPPFPIPRVGVPVYFTIQPGGATISNINGIRQQGARLVYPNFSGAEPGARIDFWNYDTQRKGWYIYGKGRVSKDGRQVLPDPGVEIYELTGAMISLPSGAPDEGPPPGGCGSGGAAADGCNADANQPRAPSGCAGDPVDCATGLFLHSSSDLFINDVMPITVTRSYRPRDPASRAFGRGTNLSYDVFLIGDSSPWTYQELVLPDGGRIHFDRTSPGTEWEDAVYAHSASATKYAGATLRHKDAACFWELKLKSGALMCFPESYLASNPRVAAVTSMHDLNGNAVVVTRTSNGNATRVTSPSGRTIEFAYDGSNRIITAHDSAGRTISYDYDADGRLFKATDPLGKVEWYTYDANHNMLSVRDKRGNLMVTNDYDANARVSKQTYADDTTNLFAYTLDIDNKVTRTEVTDERGIVNRMDFNPNGLATQITRALGLPEQQTITIERDRATGLLMSQTDALGRKTAYGYDAKGNQTSVTSMAGTPDAVTATRTYTEDFNKLASVTDALGRQSTLTYDTKGNAIREQDGLGNHVDRIYNAAGQPVQLINALDKKIDLEYAGFDLARVTDPLGRSVRLFTDSLGRVGSVTDAMGNRTVFEFDAVDRATRVSDASNHATDMGFDPSGNPISVTDSNGGQYEFAFDGRHAPTSSSDPLLRTEVVEYDGRHNRIKRTDRKGQVTRYAYDALERLVKTTYADGGTIAVSYDGANRPIQFVDSDNGTIALQYDARDGLVRVSTATGIVDYTYYANGLRKSMTVSGQPTLSYTYDDANRLTRMDQAAGDANRYVAQSLAFVYDAAGRRTRISYLNGMTRNDVYDDADKLVSIVFRHADGIVLGDLVYTYDLAGRRTATSGSLARTTLPDALASVSVDISNRLLVAGGVNLAYDANGNLTGDGVHTFVWNARDQLVRIEDGAGGTVASFAYDALGRRRSKTVGGAIVGYVYDGANIVQELGGTGGANVRANYISGRTDEVFAQLSGTRAKADIYTYLTDAQGSTIGLVDAAGAKVVDYSYGPYGDTSADAIVSNPFQFTGRENDGTGLYYYRARYYSPKLARFISSDPIGLGGGINPYAYVRGNPVKYVDPFGLAPGDPYRTQHDAARAASRQYNMSSMMDNLEYGGMIYRNADNSYSYMPATVGNAAEVEFSTTCPANTTPTAYYHTHAGYDRGYNSEQFSSEDLDIAERLGVDAYVATPNSNLKYVSRSPRRISSIGNTGFWP
jgi:RHS repeat-associated protein